METRELKKLIVPGSTDEYIFNAAKLDDQEASYYLNYNNFTDKPTSLKSPYALGIKANSETSAFTSYDGSAAKTITIAPSATAGAFTISDGTITETIQLAGEFTDNNTTYSAGSGLSLSGTTFNVNTGYTTSGKNYKVAIDSTSGGLYVNVPWTDTNTDTGYTSITTTGNGNAITSITGSGRALTATKGTTFVSTTDNLNAAINNQLDIGSSTPTDNDYYLSQYAGGGTTTTTYHRRPMSAMWNWINGKLAKVATTGKYSDLSGTPTIGSGTLTIQKNGSSVGSFSANSTSNVTANITVPTKVSELTNDSGYLTSHQSLTNYVTLNGTQTISGAKTFTAANTFTAESSFTNTNAAYTGAPKTFYDIANGILKAGCFSRSAMDTLITGQILAPNYVPSDMNYDGYNTEAATIKFQRITGTDGAAPQTATIATLSSSGLNVLEGSIKINGTSLDNKYASNSHKHAVNVNTTAVAAAGHTHTVQVPQSVTVYTTTTSNSYPVITAVTHPQYSAKTTSVAAQGHTHTASSSSSTVSGVNASFSNGVLSLTSITASASGHTHTVSATNTTATTVLNSLSMDTAPSTTTKYLTGTLNVSGISSGTNSSSTYVVTGISSVGTPS